MSHRGAVPDAQALGLGAGRVVAVTFEYGNAFAIVAGLLNMLVVLDAHDTLRGTGDLALRLMVLFAFFVSVVFAALTHDDPSAQVRAGIRMFAMFVGAGFALGWILYLFPL